MREFAVILKPCRENFMATITAGEARIAGEHFA